MVCAEIYTMKVSKFEGLEKGEKHEETGPNEENQFDPDRFAGSDAPGYRSGYASCSGKQLPGFLHSEGGSGQSEL